VARNQERLQSLQEELGRGKILPLEEALPLADIIVWVASMPKGVEIDLDNSSAPALLLMVVIEKFRHGVKCPRYFGD